jgi:hypothetical protein
VKITPTSFLKETYKDLNLKKLKYIILPLSLFFSTAPIAAKTTELDANKINISNLLSLASRTEHNISFYSFTLMGKSEIESCKIEMPLPKDLLPNHSNFDISDTTPLFKRSIVIFRSNPDYNYLFNKDFWSLQNIKNYILDAKSKNQLKNPDTAVQTENLFDINIPTPASILVKYISSVPDNLTFKATKFELNPQTSIPTSNRSFDSNLNDLLIQGSFTDSSKKNHKIKNSQFYFQIAYDFNMLFRYAAGHFFVIELDSGYTLVIQDQYSYVKNESIEKLDKIPFVKPKSSLSKKANEEFEKNIIHTLKYNPQN